MSHPIPPDRPEPLPVQTKSIPDALRDRPQWVAWCYRWKENRGEWTKIPLDVATGRNASTTDQETWAPFEYAISYHEDPHTETDGIGFVVCDDDPVVGLDLDDCREPESGNLENWAREIVENTPTYGEVSPSETGLRFFGIGSVPGGGNRGDIDGADGHLEMYDTSRYLTVTGDHVDETPTEVRKVNDTIGEIHAKYIGEDEPAANAGVDSNLSSVNPRPDVGVPGGLSDEEVIEHAKNADNGDKFQRLWKGSTSGYPSQSEADLALCGMLAFWTGGNCQQIDRLFRSSELMRDKWDADRGVQTYGERTIDKALEGQTDFYDPDNAGHQTPRLNELGHTEAEMDRVALDPSYVAVYAGLGDDEDVSDLNDRQKAATVWNLVQLSDDVHVRSRRDNGDLWAYDTTRGVWTPEGKRALAQATRLSLGAENYGQNVLAELKAQVRADVTAEIEGDRLGVDPGTLAVANGLLDLDAAADGAGDDAIRELRPTDYALTRLPVEYDPDADAARWCDLVDEWAEDGKADALQEYVGYCLHVGGMPIHRALMLVGSGANGKGTFLHVVESLLGADNTTAIELQTLANDAPARADFYGSLANIDHDLSARQLGAGLGMFKKLVAGDRIRGAAKYQHAFEYQATGKHLYAANEVPDVSDSVPEGDEAFWRRWLLVEFPNHYPPTQRDTNLKDELTTADALSGVLNWAIDGRARLLEQDYFTNEERYAQAKRERWQAWGDSVAQFISECIERDEDADNISTGDAHRRYCAWCRENDERPIGQQQFTTTLKNENVGYKTSVRVPDESTPVRGYKALGFANDVPAVEDTPERDGPTQTSLDG